MPLMNGVANNSLLIPIYLQYDDLSGSSRSHNSAWAATNTLK